MKVTDGQNATANARCAVGDSRMRPWVAEEAWPRSGTPKTASTPADSICTTFDELDEWLANGPLDNALTWIKGGLDCHSTPSSAA
jgi:hypothetical protein